jgi:hypothetical protein
MAGRRMTGCAFRSEKRSRSISRKSFTSPGSLKVNGSKFCRCSSSIVYQIIVQMTAVKAKLLYGFEEAYEEIRKHERYKALNMPAVGSVHDGYFARDKKGQYKDSRESTENQEDRDAYAVIMQDKTRLLSFAEPLKFIFSHSALREGWDNPNVFSDLYAKRNSL